MIYLFIAIFIVANIFDQISLSKDNKIIEYFSKPLIVPSIIGVYCVLCPCALSSNILTALILYTVGDIFLMFDNKKVCFVIGLLSFLVGHIYYMIWFLNIPNELSLLPAILIMLPFLILVGIFIVKVLKTKNPLGPMLLPYVLVLIAFEICVSLSIGSGNILATIIGALGVYFYTFSDACIGLNALEMKHCNGNLIMVTYITAQILLIISVLMLCNIYC